MKLLTIAVLLLSPLVVLAEQVPHSYEQCHIADARPLLDATMYTKENDYKLKVINKKPLTLVESIKLKDGHSLKIEQRGCEDIYFKFTYETPKDSRSAVVRAELLTDAIAMLKLSKNALINAKQVQDISTKIKSHVLKTKNLDETTVCLTKVTSECITEVKVTTTPTQVEFFYIDRP